MSPEENPLPPVPSNPPDMTQLPLQPAQTPAEAARDPTSTKNKPQPSLTNALLREYRAHLDPLNTGDASNMDRDEVKELKSGVSSASSTKSNESPQDPKTIPLAAPPRSIYSAKQFSPPRSVSGNIPSHRSMLNALASRSSNENLRRQGNISHTSLVDVTNPRTPFAARIAHSPCFFHQRFDDAVNIDRVLEEIAAEEDGMSHSRLLQTATSVREISKQLQRRPIRRAVRNIMIITKARDNKLVYLTRELAEWLISTPRYSSDLGVTVYVDAKLEKSKRFDAAGLIASNPRYEQMLRYWTPDLCCSAPETFDLVLTLGGDGTVLYTSWLFQRIVPPILSFSLGSLGFLTNFSFPAYKPSLDRIMEGSGMRVNMRMRFTCTVFRSARSHRSRTSSLTSTTSSRPSKTSADVLSPTAPTNSYHAQPELIQDGQYQVLNELVLDRGPSPYVSNLELYGDSHLLTIIQADGCIISTPTGSTAYSLSAGGPLTQPSIPGILLTPICPHTLSFRPMVLADTLLLRLAVPQNSRSTAYASFDGKGRVELRRGDEVRVEAGRYPFPTVVGEGGEAGAEWFDSVRRALRWNTRGVIQGGFETSQRLADYDELDKEDGANAAVKRNRGEKAGSLGSDDIDEANEDEAEEDDNDAEDEEWDIDPDPLDSVDNGTDSATTISTTGGNSSMVNMLQTEANGAGSNGQTKSLKNPVDLTESLD